MAKGKWKQGYEAVLRGTSAQTPKARRRAEREQERVPLGPAEHVHRLRMLAKGIKP